MYVHSYQYTQVLILKHTFPCPCILVHTHTFPLLHMYACFGRRTAMLISVHARPLTQALLCIILVSHLRGGGEESLTATQKHRQRPRQSCSVDFSHHCDTIKDRMLKRDRVDLAHVLFLEPLMGRVWPIFHCPRMKRLPSL